MSSATVGSVRIGRSYTRARRYPWVLGKIGDWTLPLGPYTVPQLVIAAAGIYLLIKTFSVWSPLGPLPVAALGVAVWAARASRIGGRSPLWVAYGWLRYLLQPSTGRIAGRTARAPRTRLLQGSILISTTDDPAPTTAPAPERRARTARQRPTVRRTPRPRPFRRRRAAAAAPTARPVPTPLQQMLNQPEGGLR
ncbi:hypothetical protein [Streptomyces cavernicola]|uniref:Conjugal transfer protein n=1 Tax=Streptomyces cavernicola TaxID=3043613 RepID=A0ABT6SJJ1_9ACTN|nr:hypothetical protein [Streptomyces sp. B-S-A6]MDI3408340.1 hypothetical protein [Streptomyces sp. B-S-A6]